MQVGADGLGQGVVGGVADQEMAEAVGLAPAELRRIGPDELLADQRDPSRDMDMYRTVADRRLLSGLWS
jgi:hypothetical protein